MKEGIRQGLTTFFVSMIVIALVRLAIHLVRPSSALLPHGEGAWELLGIAILISIFSGIRKTESR